MADKEFKNLSKDEKMQVFMKVLTLQAAIKAKKPELDEDQTMALASSFALVFEGRVSENQAELFVEWFLETFDDILASENLKEYIEILTEEG